MYLSHIGINMAENRVRNTLCPPRTKMCNYHDKYNVKKSILRWWKSGGELVNWQMNNVTKPIQFNSKIEYLNKTKFHKFIGKCKIS